MYEFKVGDTVYVTDHYVEGVSRLTQNAEPITTVGVLHRKAIIRDLTGAKALIQYVDEDTDTGWWLPLSCIEQAKASQPMSPEEFEVAMRQLQSRYYIDEEECHSRMDSLMCRVLESLGYKEGVKIFTDTPKWYS